MYIPVLPYRFHLRNGLLCCSRYTPNLSKAQLHSQYRGKGAECPPWQWTNVKNLEKEEKKSGKREEKFGKNREKEENREERAKIGKVLSLCPSWQIGLAMLLVRPSTQKHLHTPGKHAHFMQPVCVRYKNVPDARTPANKVFS